MKLQPDGFLAVKHELAFGFVFFPFFLFYSKMRMELPGLLPPYFSLWILFFYIFFHGVGNDYLLNSFVFKGICLCMASYPGHKTALRGRINMTGIPLYFFLFLRLKSRLWTVVLSSRLFLSFYVACRTAYPLLIIFHYPLLYL